MQSWHHVYSYTRKCSVVWSETQRAKFPAISGYSMVQIARLDAFSEFFFQLEASPVED